MTAVAGARLLRGRLATALAQGRFAVTAELTPPKGIDTTTLRRRAAALRPHVDAVNLTDNAGAVVRLASWAAARAVAEEGVEPVFQLQCRDRNRLALQSDLLGAAALGFPNVLLLTGDHTSAGDEPGAKAVFDLDALSLLQAATRLRDEGRLGSGATLGAAPCWLIGAVENPFAPPVDFRPERVARKAAAGAQFIQTQFVFDTAAFAVFLRRVEDLGVLERCAVLAGIGPVRSRRMLERLRNGVPGVNVPDAFTALFDGVPDERFAEFGIERCSEMLAELRALPGLGGVHVMAFSWEEAIVAVLERARALARRWPEGSGGGVIIDLRLDGTGPRGVKEGAEAAAAALRAVESGVLDPTRARVVGDWVQYKNNFRAPVMSRPLLLEGREELELAFDLRRADALTIDSAIGAALADGGGEEPAYLEKWVPTSASVIWRFNALYWGELALWEEASGRAYAETLPGGESAATKAEAARAVVLELFEAFDALAERHALPEHLTVLEIGVGNGEQARVWLDEFRRADAELGREYYRRLQYLMADYSTHVLDLAAATVADHRAKVSTLVLDAARPRETLRFLEGEVFFVYISNVYDNLPTDELACLGGSLYRVEVRAHLPAADVAGIAERLRMEPSWVEGLASRLVTLGPRLLSETLPGTFPDPASATAFWRDVWSCLRLTERYRPLGPLDSYLIADDLTAQLIEPMTTGQGDVRFHVSNGAVSSFLDTLPLLNPYGFLTCHDLFVTDLSQYRSAFRGPGKYDGSVVNWVNGPVLRAAASRRGYHVTFQPFAHGTRSPIVTAVARARE